ncbi:8626_t:CDS:2 [Paraglomus brasilianum]|uniref:8626_t:CDS:1 n=1 Tax=Paraglomus brasilianum TaxID=144538 RepID=A0A9N8Z2W5_9GLOM|nr:8626_t:CDS:2 [Paraglomus brasilianum]
MVVTIPDKPLELHRRRKILLAYDNSDFSKFVYQHILDNILIPGHDHVHLATVVDEEQSAWLSAHTSRAQNAGNYQGWWSDGDDYDYIDCLFMYHKKVTDHNIHFHYVEKRKTNRRLSFTDHQDASEMLKTLAQDLASKGITANFYILKGDPKVQLVKLAGHTHADLFVVGTRGLGLLKRNLIGSVSEYIVRNADCPVLVVRKKGEKAKANSRPGSPTAESSTAKKALQAPISLVRYWTK